MTFKIRKTDGTFIISWNPVPSKFKYNMCLKTVLVFKTIIENESQLQQLHTLLNNRKEVETWSIDLDDCDNVLRVVGDKIFAESIVRKTESIGIECLLLASDRI